MAATGAPGFGFDSGRSARTLPIGAGANAAKPVQLTPIQMDSVTAAGSVGHHGGLYQLDQVPHKIRRIVLRKLYRALRHRHGHSDRRDRPE